MEEFRPLQIKQYLVFMVAGEKFAIDIHNIESIHLSKRKGAFDNIEDIETASRIYKRPIPIVNLRKKLRLSGCDPVQPSLLFVKNIGENNSSLIGLQVDQTLEIIETMVPKKPDGKNPRLIKAMIGPTAEVILVLRIKDLVHTDDLVNT
jgi:chemotaxis signal transduction protein